MQRVAHLVGKPGRNPAEGDETLLACTFALVGQGLGGQAQVFGHGKGHHRHARAQEQELEPGQQPVQPRIVQADLGEEVVPAPQCQAGEQGEQGHQPGSAARGHAQAWRLRGPRQPGYERTVAD